MGSQYAVALPDKELLLVTTADTQGIASSGSTIFRAFWDTVLASLSETPLPADADAQAELSAALKGMALTTAPGAAHSPLAAEISGKTYHLFDSGCGWRGVRFDFQDSTGVMTYTNRRGTKEIPFGFGANAGFTFPETHYSGMVFGEPSGKGYEAWASAGWVDGNSLMILCHLTDDYCGNLRVNAVFDGSRVTLYMKKSAERFLDDYEGWSYGYREGSV
jgi:hypothetical protein